jgi:hypothetical protein
MPIIQTIQSFREFATMFEYMGRADQFQSLEWLYDYLEEYSDSTGEPIELDVIALCCEYTEMTYDEIACECTDIDLPDPADYSDLDEGGEVIPGTLDEEAFAEAKREAIREYLEDHTSVCGFDDETVLFAQF